MASTYSTNLAIELIGTGDQAGSWGNTTNTNLGTLIEQAISGYVTQAVSTGTDTTITIPNGATGVARNMYIELTGTGGTNTNLIVPANKKLYFIFNNSTGAVTVKVSGQTGVSVPTGKKVVLASNGTDTVNALNYIADFGSNSATITQLTATSATITNLTLTSLVISNLSIASANITTLTSSSATISTTLALSGGTANGVLYLNGSKVATSGSALTFDGTNLATTGNLDFGTVGAKINFPTTSSATKNYVGGAADGFSLEMVTQRGAIQPISYKQDYSVGHLWSLTGSSAMALTSTGLGIGTSSPSTKLQVAGNEIRHNDSTNSTGYTLNVATAGKTILATLFGGSSFAVRTGGSGSDNLLLDSSGNLGLGTSSPAERLHVVSAANSTQIRFGDNTNCNGYLGSRTSNLCTLHTDQILAFGTGSATFTERARITSTGLGITEGNNPTQALSLYRTGSTNAIMSAGNSNTGLDGTWFGVDTAGNGLVNVRGAFPLLFSTNATERARISSDGTFRVKGAGTAGSTDAFLVDGAAPASAARITSGGDLLVGTTSTAFTGKIVTLQATSASNVHTVWNSATTGDNSFIGFFTEGAGTGRGSITYNRAGGLVAYNTTSDYRAKDVYGLLENTGAAIDALKVYNGKMKGATQERPMLIAHEAQEVAPYAVGGVKDEVNEDGTPKYQQMDHSSLVPLLIAEIQSLRARVAQLESK